MFHDNICYAHEVLISVFPALSTSTITQTGNLQVFLRPMPQHAHQTMLISSYYPVNAFYTSHVLVSPRGNLGGPREAPHATLRSHLADFKFLGAICGPLLH